jgi:hypothetical protein
MRNWFVLAAAAALLTGAWMTYRMYPVYPSPMSLCKLVDARVQINDRWASPHRGAVVVLTGDLYGVPDGGYALRCRCDGHDLYVALQTTPMTLRTSETRRALRDVTNRDWRRIDRHAEFTVAARVDSEVQSCFGPGMVLSALALQSRGPVRVDKLRTPL